MTPTPSDDRIQALEEAIADLQRSRPLACYDCGRRYVKGPDLVVPDADWAKIAPHDGQGVLCPNCMHDRFVALGVPDGSVRARFKSGPFVENSFDAGLAAGRAERETFIACLIGQRDSEAEACDAAHSRARAAEQKLAALVEGIRELIAKHDALGLSYDEILERIDALLQSAAPGEEAK